MRLKQKEKEFLYMEIGKLLKAGLPIEKAAESVLDQEPPEAQRVYLESLIRSLESGSSIGEAIGEIPLKGISSLEQQLVVAGEKGGRLEHAFEHLAGYFALLTKTGETIRRQLIYPAVLIHLAVLLPAIPKAILSESPSSVIRNSIITLVLLYVISIVAVIGYRQLAAVGSTNETVDRILNRIPLSGKMRKLFAMARFSGVLRIYLLAAQRTAEAVGAAGRSSLSGSVHCASDRMESKIAAGSPLGMEMKAETVFPRDMMRSIATAEQSGTLDDEAGRWEGIFLDRAEGCADRLAIWFPKLIYAVAVVLVAWQIISMFGAYVGQLTRMMDAMP